MSSRTHWIHCESDRLKILWDLISTSPHSYWQGHIAVWNLLKSTILNLLVRLCTSDDKRIFYLSKISVSSEVESKHLAPPATNKRCTVLCGI